MSQKTALVLANQPLLQAKASISIVYAMHQEATMSMWDGILPKIKGQRCVYVERLFDEPYPKQRIVRIASVVIDAKLSGDDSDPSGRPDAYVKIHLESIGEVSSHVSCIGVGVGRFFEITCIIGGQTQWTIELPDWRKKGLDTGADHK